MNPKYATLPLLIAALSGCNFTTNVDVESIDISNTETNNSELPPPITTKPPESPQIQFVGAGDDGVYNLAEIGVDSSIELRVDIGANTSEGDFLVVQDASLNPIYSGTIDKSMIDAGVVVSIPVHFGFTSLEIFASVLNSDDISSERSTKRVIIDGIAPDKPSVQFLGAGGDDIYSLSEIGNDGTVSARIELGAATQVGDYLWVLDKNGGEVFVGEVTTVMLSGGHIVEFPISNGDTQVKAFVSVIDSASNRSPEEHAIKSVNLSPPPAEFNLTGIAAKDTNTLTFSWDGDATGITYRVCLKSSQYPDNCDEKARVSGVNVADVSGINVFNALAEDFFVISENSGGTTPSSESAIDKSAVDSLIEYIKPFNGDSYDYFGYTVSLNHDGNLLAVGAYGESSALKGVNGNGADNFANISGAVYVFRNSGSGWVQEAYLKASNSQEADFFGYELSLSDDGSTLAVGAYREDSGSLGVNGDQTDNSATWAGAVYIFKNDKNNWTQEAYLKASNTGAGDRFGFSVGLSGDGDVLVVGAPYEGSYAYGVNGDQDNDFRSKSGAVYVFRRDGVSWAQEAYIKSSNADSNDEFGYSVGLSGDGSLLAVSSPDEDSFAVGVDGDQNDDSQSNSGAVYVFGYDGINWAQKAYLKASNTEDGDAFGTHLSLSSDGSKLAVSAPLEDSSATGVNGDGSDNSSIDSGAVYLFSNDGVEWAQDAYIKASNNGANDVFGKSLSLNENGSILGVTSYFESSSSQGINGEQLDDLASMSGAAYLFKENEGRWEQSVYLKSPNSEGGDLFGRSIALSGDGYTVVVGASGEESNSIGVNGDQLDNSLVSAGAVYIYD